jgi:hypothetical protein
MGCNVLTRPIGLLAVFFAVVVLTVRERRHGDLLQQPEPGALSPDDARADPRAYYFRLREDCARFRTPESTL